MNNLLNYIFPQTLEVINSSHNGQIKVVKQFGHLAVWCGGYEQSGPIVEKIWRKALDNYFSKATGIKKILILGLGCGSVVPILTKRFPGTNITGVEVDPVIVELGKKYFSLGRIKELKIVMTDALKFIDIRSDNQFDFIIADLYKGGEMGDNYFVKKLAKGISRLLKPSGVAAFNLLTFGKSPGDQEKFVKIIDCDFSVIKKLKNEYNIIYFSRIKS